jgi:hypothetical protein
MKLFNLGEIVFDDLINDLATITKVDVDKNGNVGYFVDNTYLGGGRHPWELSKIEDVASGKNIQ